MTIQLGDDGTLDTVLYCSDCRQEYHFNYDPEADDYPHGDQAEDSYNNFVDECIAELKAEHVCHEEDC